MKSIVLGTLLVLVTAGTAMAAGPAIKPGMEGVRNVPSVGMARRTSPLDVAVARPSVRHSDAKKGSALPRVGRAPAQEQRRVDVGPTVTATCNLITVDAGAPSFILIRTVEKGVMTPTPEQEQIVDEEGPVLGLSQGRGSYEWEISVTYSDTVEDRHGTVDC